MHTDLSFRFDGEGKRYSFAGLLQGFRDTKRVTAVCTTQEVLYCQLQKVISRFMKARFVHDLRLLCDLAGSSLYI